MSGLPGAGCGAHYRACKSFELKRIMRPEMALMRFIKLCVQIIKNNLASYHYSFIIKRLLVLMVCRHAHASGLFPDFILDRNFNRLLQNYLSANWYE